jgi:hypothetical protein
MVTNVAATATQAVVMVLLLMQALLAEARRPW